MRAAIRDLTEVLARANGSTMDLSGLGVPTGCYGGVGTAMATANAALQSRSASTMTRLLSVLGEISNRLARSADDYDRADEQIARMLRELAAADRWGTHRAPHPPRTGA